MLNHCCLCRAVFGLRIFCFARCSAALFCVCVLACLDCCQGTRSVAVSYVRTCCWCGLSLALFVMLCCSSHLHVVSNKLTTLHTHAVHSAVWEVGGQAMPVIGSPAALLQTPSSCKFGFARVCL